MQKINKTARHIRNVPIPYEWISGSCQKDNLPPNTGHRMKLPFSSSTLIPTFVSEHQLPNASHYNTVTRAGKPPTQQVSPFSKADITSCRICPTRPTPLLSLRRNTDHSYSTDCSGDPKNHSEGGQFRVKATQASCPGQAGPRGCAERAGEEWGQPACTCERGGGGWWHPTAAAEVSARSGYAGGKRLAAPPASSA